MPLPILQTHQQPSRDDLVRLFHRTELHWSRHLGEEAALEAGTAIANPQLGRVWDANRVLDAAVPEGAAVAELVGEVEAHFSSQGSRCAQWTMNPSAAPDRTTPLTESLIAGGWREAAEDILYLAGRPQAPIREAGGLTIVPARASFRHWRQLAEEWADGRGEPQLAEAAMLHLDDPHYDALLALQDGAAVGRIGVLAVGEVGRVDQVYVAEAHRRRGIGRTLMSRALEICARSLFRHVLLSLEPGNDPARSLYEQVGFRMVGHITSYRAPQPHGRHE
jgi:ribosomal protein S18 acetylase RimI-like enzyme